ncbi:MAG TPA: AAA family ATPase [Methylomirabilota bacterium]
MTSVFAPHEPYRQRAFALTPDPAFLYLAQSHRAALEALRAGVDEGAAFMVLTGEVGTGKTTILRALCAGLPETVTTAFVGNPALSFADILYTLLAEVGHQPASMRKADLLADFAKFLVTEHGRGRTVLVIVDEAQHLSAPVVQDLLMLSDLEGDASRLVHFLLAGQPELTAMLQRPEVHQLQRRITVRTTLRPLTRPETAAYIAHRLRSARVSSACRFTTDAVDRIFELSEGIPRMINHICQSALEAGHRAGTSVIAADTVDLGSPHLVEREGGISRLIPRRRVRTLVRVAEVTVLAILVTILGLALAFVPRSMP